MLENTTGKKRVIKLILLALLLVIIVPLPWYSCFFDCKVITMPLLNFYFLWETLSVTSGLYFGLISVLFLPFMLIVSVGGIVSALIYLAFAYSLLSQFAARIKQNHIWQGLIIIALLHILSYMAISRF